MDELIAPFLVEYSGRDTDRHIIQADLFGKSVVGGARLYTAVAHYCMFGFVPEGKYKRDVTVFAEPAKAASFDQWFHLLPVIGGQYALAANFYNEAFSYLFGKVCDSLKHLWTRQSEVQAVVEALTKALMAQAEINADLQTVLANGLIRANDNATTIQSKLIETLPALASATRPHAANFVVPIGVTCTTISQFKGTTLESTITEHDARVIRGKGATQVRDAEAYRVKKIKEIDVETGHCIVDVEGIGRVVGEITDPALKTADNIYTSALDEQLGCNVIAKAVTINGIIDKLVISDAKP